MRTECALTLLLFSLSAGRADASELVNMPKLLVIGEEYANKEVSFTGYSCANPDSKNGVFLTLDDCERSNYDNAVQLLNRPEDKTCNGLVTITGTFRFEKGAVWLDNPYQWGRVEVTNHLCLSRNRRYKRDVATDPGRK